ncbi:MAG: SDR family NAD(P)-dependent oxidoreductase [Bacteroidales bacterium]
MEQAQWALIAGSAEGLGEAFTLLLAEQGFNLILVDRDEEALGKIVRKVVKEFDIKVVSLCLDLGEQDAWKVCMDAVRDAGCGMLVYCAAMSEVKPFLDHSPENLNRFIDVNNRTAMLLVHAFAGYLRDQKKPGKILLMSSLAGLMSPVYVTPYAASKAFLISLSRSLYHELKPLQIGISVCCAGIINTPKFLESRAHGDIPMADPFKVAAYAIKMSGKKAVCIHGFTNRLSYFFISVILPSALASYFVNRAMRKMYPTFSR